MKNYNISHDKTMFDLFNMTNLNCYQAFIIQSIFEDKKEDIIQLCNELSTAAAYYKWELKPVKSDYIDSLICESGLKKWQKIAMFYILSNDYTACKSLVEKQIKEENKKETINPSPIQNINNVYKDYLRADNVAGLLNLLGF